MAARLPRGTAWTGLTTERHDPYARFDEATLVEAVLHTRPKGPPGQRFRYSRRHPSKIGRARSPRPAAG